MKTFLYALALASLMEGICLALFPALVRLCLEELLRQGPEAIRKYGAALLGFAIAISFFAAIIPA